jgi:hypothetical protein
MTTGRERFDDVLAGRTDGPAMWMPLVDELAARVQATSYRELTTDPGLWAAGLAGAAQLLGADALVAGFDPTLNAEACGAELGWSASLPSIVRRPPELASQPQEAPRQAALLETLRRLRATARARLGLVAALSGPALLARQLLPDLPLEEGLRRIKPAQTALTEAVLAARPDLILYIEQLPESEPQVPRAWQRAFGTLRNLAAHYDVPAAVYAEAWTAQQIPGLASLRLPVYLLGSGAGDALAAARILAAERAGVGVPISTGASGDARATMAAVHAARREGRNFFLTTAGAVGGQGDLTGLREFAVELQGRAA